MDWSSRSAGSLAANVSLGTDLRFFNPYPFRCDRLSRPYKQKLYYLWHFAVEDDSGLELAQTPWRFILDQIVRDIIADDVEQRKTAASINGVTSSANGMVRIDRRPATVKSAILQRLHASALDNPLYRKLVNHPKFHEFCSA